MQTQFIFPSITALLTIYLSAILVFFIFKIASVRVKDRVELLTGDNDRLTRLVRSHANLVETSPLFLIMLGLLEASGASTIFIAAVALLFAISRTIHPIGLSGIKGTFLFRTFGMIMSVTAYVLVGGYLGVTAISLA